MHKKHTIAPFRLGVVLASIRRISQSTSLRQEAADVRKMISRQANYSNFHSLFLHLHCDTWLKLTLKKAKTYNYISLQEKQIHYLVTKCARSVVKK